MQRGIVLPSKEAKATGATNGSASSRSAPSAAEVRPAPAQPPPPSTSGGPAGDQQLGGITQQFSQSETGGLQRQLSANQQTLQ
jgi:hypothetical protein